MGSSDGGSNRKQHNNGWVSKGQRDKIEKSSVRNHSFIKFHMAINQRERANERDESR